MLEPVKMVTLFSNVTAICAMLRLSNSLAIVYSNDKLQKEQKKHFGMGLGLGSDKQNLNTNYNCLPDSGAEKGYS